MPDSHAFEMRADCETDQIHYVVDGTALCGIPDDRLRLRADLDDRSLYADAGFSGCRLALETQVSRQA